ncbi:MAG: 1,4-alpha-glucan branching protein GlgB [Thermoplasmata archaeon]
MNGAPRPPIRRRRFAPRVDRTLASSFTDLDVYLFNEGTHFRLYDKLGAHPAGATSPDGTRFAVWAPNAEAVSVIGECNDWTAGVDGLESRGSSGVFEGVVPAARSGQKYKYRIRSRLGDYEVDKADPFAFRTEVPPATSSYIWEPSHPWQDAEWMAQRESRSDRAAPISIYEVHLGSWRRVPEEENRSLTYREIAGPLIDHVTDLGFTHVEFLPLAEHAFYGSWGYEPTAFFAPTARYGEPGGLMELIDALHRAGIGVILDWVPSHFPSDGHSLSYFDGTHLYEHDDPRKGWHPEWHTMLFNYGRNEVRAFLGSSAVFWLDRYHADGLRVDGVASMLYLDYSRRPGEWLPNEHGGRENLEALRFLRWLNEVVYGSTPGTQTFAEESTAWPNVSRPTSMQGLGFGYKWDMGWMHDTLEYFRRDPIHRPYHQDELTFRMVYAYTENFVLALSHDEVVYGKGSLLARMPGDPWQRLANLRLLYAYQAAQPGKKLVFMGGEFAQEREWNHDASLDWHLAHEPSHAGICAWVRALNRMYRATPALYEGDTEPFGFEWVDHADHQQSVLSFLRRPADGRRSVLAVFNFTPVPRDAYRLGVPVEGSWSLLENSDRLEYGGSGAGTITAVVTETTGAHGRPYSLSLSLPPLGALFLQAPR